MAVQSLTVSAKQHMYHFISSVTQQHIRYLHPIQCVVKSEKSGDITRDAIKTVTQMLCVKDCMAPQTSQANSLNANVMQSMLRKQCRL